VATRLYGVATTPAPVSPTTQGGWFSQAGYVVRNLSLNKAAATETRSAVNVTSGANNNALAFQLVSPPLAAQTIAAGGTISIIMRGRELATTDNINKRYRMVYVVSNDGSTVRGTLVTFAATASTTELGTSLSGTVMAINAGIGSALAVSAGDRIVVEVGYGMSSTGTTPQYDMVIGGNGTDHTTTEGDTTGTVPWIEFSQNLTWAPITESVLGLGTGTRAFPDAVVPSNPGKLVVRIGAENGNAVGNLTPSGGGLTWTKRVEANAGDVNNAFVQIWTADTASTTPVTVTITPSGGGSPSTAQYAATVDADPGTGIGVSSAGTGKTRTINPATGSHVYGVVADWSAGATGTIAWTPSGATADYAEQDAVHMTAWFGEWPSVTTGSVAYGLSTPSPTTPSTAVLEITAGVDARSAATQDSFTAASAIVDAKTPARATQDSVGTADRPTGSKTPARATVDSLAPVGIPVKQTIIAKSAATVDALGTAGRPAGTKGESRALVDSAAAADAVVARKTPAQATVDSTAATEVLVSRKTPARATVDSLGPAAAVPTRKSVATATQDSLTPQGQPVKLAGKTTQDSAGAADAAAGFKAASRAVADAVGTAGRPAGTRSAIGVATDSAATADRPAVVKGSARAVADSATPTDRPAATRAAARALVDSTAAADRPTLGSKARSATLADSLSPDAIASKGLTATHPAASSVAPTEALVGRKSASGATSDSVGTASRPAAGAVARTRATVDAVSCTARPAGRKTAIVVAGESASPTTRIIATRAVVGSTRASLAAGDSTAGRKLGNGATRSSASPSGLPFRVLIYRNIRIKTGRLRPTGPGGTLHRYAPDGSIVPTTIAGVVRRRGITGRLHRYGDT
jgi:hypothetical protein